MNTWNGKCHNCSDALICANCNYVPNFNALLEQAKAEGAKEGISWSNEQWSIRIVKEGDESMEQGHQAERARLVGIASKMGYNFIIPDSKDDPEEEYRRGYNEALSKFISQAQTGEETT